MNIRSAWCLVWSGLRKSGKEFPDISQTNWSPLSWGFQGEASSEEAMQIAVAMQPSAKARGHYFPELDTLTTRSLPEWWHGRWKVARIFLGVDDPRKILEIGAGPYLHDEPEGRKALVEARRILAAQN